MRPLIETNLGALAALLLGLGIVAGLLGARLWWSDWRARSAQRRLFSNVKPTQWPRTDYRVGRTYRTQDTK